MSCMIVEQNNITMPHGYAWASLPEAAQPRYTEVKQAQVENDRRAVVRSLRGKYRDVLPTSDEFATQKRSAGDRW